MGGKKGVPWVSVGIGFGLLTFYSIWLTHSYRWSYTPLDAVVATVLTAYVPLGTIYIVSRVLSWILRKPYDEWTTED